METKVCSKCGFEKDVSGFRKSDRHTDGYNGVCKDCINKDSNKRYHGIRNGTYIKKEKFLCDDNFFTEINSEEKAYWLGFLYADGYVRIVRGSCQMKLKLSTKDKNHIEKFQKSIKSNYEIKDSEEILENKGKKYTMNSSALNVYSCNLVNDLINLGCVNNKTFKIRLPNLTFNMMPHFIRGYFDGDGCIYRNKKRPNSFVVSIVSNKKFCDDLLEFLNIGKILNFKNYSILTISKISDVKKIRDYMYNDSTIFLERKKIIFEQIKDEYKRDYNLTIRNFKQYNFVTPDNKNIIVNNLKEFCNNNNLKINMMYNLISGASKVSKSGWKYK